MAKVMLSIPDDFLKQVDEVAKSRHQSRSEYFRELARRDIEQRQEAERQESLHAVALEWERIRDLAKRTRAASRDRVAEIRRLRAAGLAARQVEQVHDAPEEDSQTG